jgi:hypothetical protein
MVMATSPSDGNAVEAAAGDLLAAALDYAARGLLVFPCRGKVPLTAHGFQEATTDPGVIAEWWRQAADANVAVRTGAESGVTVLDIDAEHGGFGSLAELERKHGKLPKTARVLTGGGGQHIYFFHPVGRELRNSAGRLGAGLDVRGDGGYVIAPPSVHDSGRPYKWMRPLERGLADCPPWLLDDADKRRNGTAPKVEGLIPAGQRNDALASLAGTMRRRGMSEAAILAALREENRRCEPPLDDDELARIAGSVARYAPAEDLGKPAYDGPARELVDVLEVFRRWLYLPDPGALYVTLGTVAANRMPGDPVWLLLVAASSSGKTEILLSLSGLDEIVPAATLTEASLLSGVPRKDVASGATGGLLRKVGDYGVFTLKDFGSVLSMPHATRAQTLAALREVFDGSWDRPMGTDGGKVLSWQGKLGLIAGVTTVVDRHHAVMDSLGSRFAFYRVDVDERASQTRRALAHRRGTREMRTELRDVVSALFAGMTLPDDDSLTETDRERLIVLADFVTMARSPVERDSYSREIELVPDPEAPARFALMLASLLEGLYAIGLDSEAAWQLVAKVAFDSMPAQRRQTIALLAEIETTTTKTAAIALGLPTTTTRRVLEDLAAHKLVQREESTDKRGDTWSLTAWTRDKYRESTVPEKSQDQCPIETENPNDDFSGTT